MTIGKLATISAALAFASLACDARTLIGMVPDGSAPDDGAPHSDAFVPDVPPGTEGHTCTPVTFPGDAPYTLPAGVAGTWTGYFQGGSPLAASDVLTLSIQQLADGSGEIRVVMGTAAAPPPATSPTDYYPPGGPTGTEASQPRMIEGFPYVGHAVTWQGQRLQLKIADDQPWQSWCALQTSYYVATYAKYNCVPGLGGGVSQVNGVEECSTSDGDKQTPVPCGQLMQCNGRTCACDACGCAAGVSLTDSFDVTFDGDTASGVGVGHNVRLMRTAN